MTGAYPIEVDHKNRIRNDNRWSNLEASTRSDNSRNTKIRSDNTSGVKGVNRDKRRGTWRVRIHNKGREVHLGEFNTFEDAVKARELAEIKYGYK